MLFQMALRCRLIALAATVVISARGARRVPGDAAAPEPRAPDADQDATTEAPRPAPPEPLAPIVWVPGFTSGPLEAYYNSSRGPLRNRWCHRSIPKDKWYTLFVSTSQALSPICYVWQMQLRPPETPGGCVRDAEGLEIREIGFGKTYAASAVNPSDYIQFKLYDKMIKELEKAGLERDRTIRFAMYDWRKFGDRCWERDWYPRLKRLVEETAEDAGRSVTLGCHSMGCLVIVAFLDSDFVDDAWKRKYVREFLAVGPTFAGSSMIMLNFMQGPTYQSLPLVLSKIGRDAVASMPALYTLMPVKGLGGWDEGLTIIETPWKNYSIDSIYDGTFYNDVEGPEGLHEPAQATFSLPSDGGSPVRALGSGSSAGSVSSTDLESTAEDEDGNRLEEHDGAVVLTERGCICSSACSRTGQHWQQDIGAYVEGLPRALRKTLLRPYCATLGACGHWDLMTGHWDYCDVSAAPSDAGPGFEFYPLVDEPERNYFRVREAQVEELKQRCLADARCSGFTLDGWFKEGAMSPRKSWQAVAKWKGDHLPGLFVKRPEVRLCQISQASSIGFKWAADDHDHGALCGSDGRTYEDALQLHLAQCWRVPAPTKVHNGACSTSRTVSGCQCFGECTSSAVPSFDEALRFPWCFTQDKCGYAMPEVDAGPLRSRTVYWDYCKASRQPRVIDTGRGFEYTPSSTNKGLLLSTKVAAPFSLDALQASCGEDPSCGGFTTEGWLLRVAGEHDVEAEQPLSSGFPNPVAPVSTDEESGVYRKLSSISSCQRACRWPLDERRSVCVIEMRRTFESRCAAESALCYLDGIRRDGEVSEHHARHRRYIDGPCKRQMRTDLHHFAMDWVRRAQHFKPPGVPLTCFYITDVPTESTWRVADFLGKGDVLSSLPGDGTVTAQSIQGPCELWQRQQEAPVRLVPTAFSNGVAHVTMIISDASIAEVLKLVKEPWAEAEDWARRAALPAASRGGVAASHLGHMFAKLRDPAVLVWRRFATFAAGAGASVVDSHSRRPGAGIIALVAVAANLSGRRRD